MLDDLALFIKVAELGSFSKAAAAAGVPAPTLTRRVQKLEAELGCQLLHRSARRLQLTAAGRKVFDESYLHLSSLDKQMALIKKDISAEEGEVRVLAPVNLANGPLRPLWGDFMSRYPNIQLTLQLNNRVEDFTGSQAELAVRVGPLANSALRQRLLGSIRTVLVATPDAAAEIEAQGAELTPSELGRWPWVASISESIRRLRHRHTGEMVNIDWRPRAHINDLSLAIDILKTCGGWMLCPVSLVWEDLQRGDLRQILSDWEGANREVHVVWNDRNILLRRTQLLLDFLTEETRRIPSLLGELPAVSKARRSGLESK
ncbi:MULTISPECIES: LysR family transcriptional regulator [unclassified Hahella]|uniref:LysR family transcriptional regulator n=1 Tax=unclassified Hahella TaxID=2624107 RepID=UPI001C1EC771|nr:MULTISPECIES: LysR family transcriptional regulator [unclassified Hahella]MBU6954819.1 LysR family transcriptional regulator [Hahella sp. HN01]MDG9668019.1 LysR family transcriptional regulator [Hahella sp. CR1]